MRSNGLVQSHCPWELKKTDTCCTLGPASLSCSSGGTSSYLGSPGSHTSRSALSAAMLNASTAPRWGSGLSTSIRDPCGRHTHAFVHADPGLSPPPIGCILPTLPPTFELRVPGCGCLSGLSADQDPDLKTLGFSWPQRWHETIYPFFKHPEKVKQWSSALVRHTGPIGNQVRG